MTEIVVTFADDGTTVGIIGTELADGTIPVRLVVSSASNFK